MIRHSWRRWEDLDGDTLELLADGTVLATIYGGVHGPYSLDDLEADADFLNLPDEAYLRFSFGGRGGEEVLEQARAALARSSSPTGRISTRKPRTPPNPGRPAREEDLKPRGVKRRWWLVPLDALRLALGRHRYEDGLALAAAADYQRSPSVGTARCLAGALLGLLEQEIAGVPFDEIEDTEEFPDLDELVRVFEHGADKYAPDNWRRAAGDREGFRREYLSSVCRHLFPTNGPLDLDHTLPDGTEVKGSGLRHTAHAACAALMILWHEMQWEAA